MLIFYIIYIIGMIIIGIGAYKLIKIDKLEPIIIELITEAESKFKSGEGSEKFEYVFDKLYNTLAPKPVKILFSAQEIRNIIQYIFNKVKIALDYKGVNDGQ